MSAVRLVAAAAVAFAASCVAAPARYLELVNRSRDTVTGLAIAAAGSDAFDALPLAEPLHGSGAVTVAVRGAGCVRDVRVTFRTGLDAVYRRVDVCRRGGLYIDDVGRLAR